MEEARAVISRLDRIEALARAREPAETVLGELALLVAEAELWLKREKAAGTKARTALERCLWALENGAGERCHGAGAFARLKSP